MNTPKPKHIEEITVEDLREHRWCYYHNDEEGYDCFEYVVPDTHPGFEDWITELELAHFHFSNGAVAYGCYDGSESFHIFADNQWYSFWYGVAKPTAKDSDKMQAFLQKNRYQLPVAATAVRSGRKKSFSGLEYLDDDGELHQVDI